MAQLVKNLSAMQETWVGSLDREDPLEKEMAAHSSSLAWRIPWTEELGRLSSMGSKRIRHDCVTNFRFFISSVYSQSPSPNSSHHIPFPLLVFICLFSISMSLFLFFLCVGGDCWSFLSCAVFMMAHGLFVTLTSPVAGFRLSI